MCLQQALEREATLKEIIRRSDAAAYAYAKLKSARAKSSESDESPCIFVDKSGIRCLAARFREEGVHKYAYCSFKHGAAHFRMIRDEYLALSQV